MKFTLCKKQYIYLALAVISISLAITSHVSAQGPQEAMIPPIENLDMDAIRERNQMMEERREEVAEQNQIRRSALMERVQDRITNLSRNMEGRMQAAIGRIDQIAGRMDTRIKKLEGEDIDVVQAKMVLGLSRESLEAAREALAGIDTAVVNGVTSDHPGSTFGEIKKRFTAARNAIKDSHTHLQTTLMLLKDAIRQAESNTGVSDAVRNENSINASSSSAQ